MSHTIIGSTVWSDGYIDQVLDLSNDSIKYLNSANGEELASVDSCGYTRVGDKVVGKFCLDNNRWYFRKDGKVFMADNAATAANTYELIEFELLVIPKLLELKP